MSYISEVRSIIIMSIQQLDIFMSSMPHEYLIRLELTTRGYYENHAKDTSFGGSFRCRVHFSQKGLYNPKVGLS
jgi:hypothetical protein